MDEGRLLKHWEQLQLARGQARASIPSSWWRDPRPEMQEVIDTFVEAVARRVEKEPTPAGDAIRNFERPRLS
jgi:hypothetical protein